MNQTANPVRHPTHTCLDRTAHQELPILRTSLTPENQTCHQNMEPSLSVCPFFARLIIYLDRVAPSLDLSRDTPDRAAPADGNQSTNKGKPPTPE